MWRAGLTETHRKYQVCKYMNNRQSICSDSGCSTFVLSSLQDLFFKWFIFRFGLYV